MASKSNDQERERERERESKLNNDYSKLERKFKKVINAALDAGIVIFRSTFVTYNRFE